VGVGGCGGVSGKVGVRAKEWGGGESKHDL
jgi:hypothetical protein